MAVCQDLSKLSIEVMPTLFLITVVVLGISLASLLILIGRVILFAVPMLHDPVFVPSSDSKLRTMLKLAKIKKGKRIIDLGCGDGKVIFAVAKKGFSVEGVEINPILVRRCKKRIKQLGLDKLVTVSRASFWNIDFSKYDLIFLYGTSYIMERLEKKLLEELRPSSRVVSNRFQFPNWKADQTENGVRVYVKS